MNQMAIIACKNGHNITFILLYLTALVQTIYNMHLSIYTLGNCDKRFSQHWKINQLTEEIIGGCHSYRPKNHV